MNKNKMSERLFVVSTAIVPPNFHGGMIVMTRTPEGIREVIQDARAIGIPVITYVGHPATAGFLGVPIARTRDTLDGASLTFYDRLVGIRPLVRPEPGVELEVTPENFQGFILCPAQPAEMNL